MSNYVPGFLADEIVKSGGVLKAAVIRKDYSRMRKIAQKRLKRFEGTEWVDSDVYRYNKNRFKRLDQIKTAGELALLTVEVQRFLQSPTGSITGLKKQRTDIIAQMHEHGYTWITAKNFRQFTKFMDKLRSSGIARMFDSERLGEMLSESVEQGVTADELARDFEKFVAKEVKSGRASKLPRMSTDELKRRLGGNGDSGKSTRQSSGRNRKR